MREYGERPEAPYRRPALMWWELLAYALILAIALALNALQFSKWVAAPPLVLVALVVRAVRIGTD